MSPATLSASSTALAAWRCSLRFVAPHQKIGQSDLAAMAGIARESVSRIRCKLVNQLGGYYCIENKAQLQKEAQL